MAKLVTVAHGLPSLVYPTVELSRRLAAAGHRVTFAGDRDARDLVERNGLAFLLLEPSRYDDFLAADANESVLHRILTVRKRRERAADALAVDAFTRAMRENAPDLVLINGEMHAHIVAAAAAKIPVALLNSFVSIWRQPGVPPPHHLASPGRGWRGTPAGAFLLWENLRIVKWRKRLSDRLRRVGCDRVAALATLARRGGFHFAREIDTSQWLIPFTYRRLPVLSLHALEFEFSDRLPGHVHYVGPMVLESRLDRTQSTEDAARLAGLVARRQASSKRKLIYAGFGSVLSTSPSFLRRLARIVEGRPDWDLVITLSNRIARSSLEPVPPRVHLFDWVPQTELLRYADVVVTHGGVNTVDECVMRAVPMLVYWGGETDMGGTTARVVHHGIGIAGDMERDGPDEIRRHIDRLLHVETFRQNVERLQRSYAAYAGNRVAERVVDTLLARSTHGTAPSAGRVPDSTPGG